MKGWPGPASCYLVATGSDLERLRAVFRREVVPPEGGQYVKNPRWKRFRDILIEFLIESIDYRLDPSLISFRWIPLELLQDVGSQSTSFRAWALTVFGSLPWWTPTGSWDTMP